MTIFYINYWGLNDPLTTSSTFPHLEILEEMDSIDEVVFFTMERDENLDDSVLVRLSKVKHVPVHSKKFFLNTLTKLSDFKKMKAILLKQYQEYQPSKVICRSSMAGYFGYWLWKKTKTPFYVESFEPHADYMAESGVWKKGGVRYNIQNKIEQNIKKHASAIMPVSENYKRLLKEEGVDVSIEVIPCSVDVEKFRFSEDTRASWRKKLKVEDKTVGVYVGKFGGMYMDDEALKLFVELKKEIGDTFFLLILTPSLSYKDKLLAAGFSPSEFYLDLVPHEDIPCYLSAADFAFSLVKKSRVTKCFSPIKNGEYWASGLPILIPENIGDDSDIIKKEGGGAVIDVDDSASIAKGLSEVTKVSRGSVMLLAKKHRSRSISKKVYQKYYGEE